MSARVSYLERGEFHVVNVIGSTLVLEVQLEVGKIVSLLHKAGVDVRVLVDLSNATLEGSVDHLHLFLQNLETHILAESHGPRDRIVFVRRVCPLADGLEGLTDVFETKLAALDARFHSFCIRESLDDALALFASASA